MAGQDETTSGRDPVRAGRLRPPAALARNAALRRVSRTRRWVIAATAALTAGFAALVSAVAPGHSVASQYEPRSAAESRAGGPSGLPAMPAPANPADLGLQGPSQAPTPAPDQSQSPPSQPPSSSGGGDGPVVSGGS